MPKLSSSLSAIVLSFMAIGIPNVHAQTDEELLQELENSLSAYDDVEISQLYELSSSASQLKLGGVSLVNLVNQSSSKHDLVSNVESISGATSIVSDPTGFGFTVDLSGDFLFEFDKAILTEQAIESLKNVKMLYTEYQGNSIEIIGHTDSKGDDSYNLDLSIRRANSVKNWFVATSIDASLIKTQGAGESQPVAKNEINGQDNPQGRALNRRVEISIKTDKKVNHLPTTSNTSSISTN